MKKLNISEIKSVSGGCGPQMVDGIVEGFVTLLGIAVVGAFVVGAASVHIYQYAVSKS